MRIVEIPDDEYWDEIYEILITMIDKGIEPRWSWTDRDEVTIETGLGSNYVEKDGSYTFRQAYQRELGGK
jgi:hypothetical protein